MLETGDDYELARPRAAATFQSLRSIGYTPETAVADIVDNSVAAGARKVNIEATWAGRDSFIRISDDGVGMTEDVLGNAMRLSSRNPLEPREARDLGRFGMGLKTASLSQARRLFVASRPRNGVCSVRGWDLDYIDRQPSDDFWLLRRTDPKTGERLGAAGLLCGTIVLWERLDRLVGDVDVDNEAAHAQFLAVIASIEMHLALVFQRLMTGNRRVKLVIQGHEVVPLDPFLEDEPATQRFPIETLSYSGRDIRLEAFVLPHHSRLTPERFASGAGPRGWTRSQGFYVYRNSRLVVAGDWLGLGLHQEVHYQLARIRVDIDNGLDEQWRLDIMKATAVLPAELKGTFKRVAAVARTRARDVYRARGKSIARSAAKPFAFVWKQHFGQGTLSYRIERGHPLVQEALADTPQRRKVISAMLNLIEETVPHALITVDAAERPQEHAAPFASRPAEVSTLLKLMYGVFRQQEMTHGAIVERLATMEPFDQFPELIAGIQEDPPK